MALSYRTRELIAVLRMVGIEVDMSNSFAKNSLFPGPHDWFRVKNADQTYTHFAVPGGYMTHSNGGLQCVVR